jgi:uncharacterized phage-associated protein
MRARYSPNPEKALEVILWIANRQGGRSDFYHILKILYFADKYHLRLYGRPIVGDTYDARYHGPVARLVYNILKGDAYEWQALQETVDKSDLDNSFNTDGYIAIKNRAADKDALSRSDIEALEVSFQKYSGMSFKELRELTHEERAWQEAWNTDRPLEYDTMLEGEVDSERIEDIVRTARQTAM